MRTKRPCASPARALANWRATSGIHCKSPPERGGEKGGASREWGPEAAALPASLLSWVPNYGTGRRPSPASSLQIQPLAVPGRRRQGHSGQGRDPGWPSQVSSWGKAEVPIWAGRGPLRLRGFELGAQPGVRRSCRRCTLCSRLCCTEGTDHPLCVCVHPPL